MSPAYPTGGIALIREVLLRTGCDLREAVAAVEEAQGDLPHAVVRAGQLMLQRNGSPPLHGATPQQRRSESTAVEQVLRLQPELVDLLVTLNERITTCCVCHKHLACVVGTIFTPGGRG